MKKWLFVVSVVILFANLWGFSIYILDESKNAQCAWEMLHSGNWLEPTFNGDLRTDKPPLHYGFMAASYALFGKSAFAARFFSAVMGLFVLFMVYAMSRKYINKRAANLAVIVLLSFLMFGIQFRLATPDAYLIAFLSAAMFSWYHGRKSNRTIYVLLGFAALALAFLAKGPIAIVLAGISIFTYHIANREFNWKTIAAYKKWFGVPIFLLLAVPWFYLAHQATDGAFTNGFFIEHNFERYTGTMEGHSGFPGLSVIFLLIASMPFGFIVFPALKKRKLLRNDFVWYATTMVVSVVVFFLFSQTMLPNYVSPALPFLAIPIAWFLDRWLAGKLVFDPRPFFLLLAVLGIAFVLGAFFGMERDIGMRPVSYLAWLLAVLPLSALVAFWFYTKKATWKSIISLAGGYMLMQLLLVAVIFPQLDKTNPVHKSAHLFRDDTPVYHYKRMNASFVFNLDRRIPNLDNLLEISTVLAQNEEIIIITRKDREEDLNKISNLKKVFEHKDLFEGHTTVIYRSKSTTTGK